MEFTRKSNIRKQELLERIKAIPGASNKQKFCVNSVFMKQGDKWTFLIGKCAIDDEKQSASKSQYIGFHFFTSIFETSIIELVEQFYEGFSFHADMTELVFPEDTNWEEDLVPSHVAKTVYPLRSYTAKICDTNSFNDTKLIGYDAKFQPSAKEHIQDFLNLSGSLGHRDSREGSFLIELEDSRGKISVTNNTLSIDTKDPSLRVVGKNNMDDEVFLKYPDTKQIEEFSNAELWLLNEQEEIFDYISSSEWPHVFVLQDDNNETNKYGVIVSKGEGSDCEFKPYLSLRENKNLKISQIAKTVCSFSNAGGGNLFIGINDDAEIEDITASLRRDYNCEANEAIKMYITDLKKALKENLTQDNCFIIQSEKIFSKNVIVISVTQADDINSVRSERQAYIRKGATSMKMLHEEMQRKNKNLLF